MEAVVEVASSAAKAAGEAAAERVAARYEDHYQEPEVRRALLSLLRLIKDDDEALRNAQGNDFVGAPPSAFQIFHNRHDLEAARRAMQSWHDSPNGITSDMRMDYLRRASAHATEAFDLVKETVDKIRAASLLIFADYHLIAPSGEGEPDWITGKRAAQRLLRQYAGGLKQLATAAREETAKDDSTGFLETERRMILREFSRLSATVFWLHPRSENGGHPRFPDLEQAALHACDSDGSYVTLPAIGHLISEPRIRGTLKGHTNSVTCCSTFANGTRAVSGSWDHTLKVWDLVTGEEIQTATGHTGPVWCCSVFENGMRAVSGGWDGTLKVWDLTTGEEMQILTAHTGGVLCCSVFAQDTRLVSGSVDNTLKVWDLAKGEVMHTLKGHTYSVSCCSVFVQDTRLVSGSGDNTLELWDLAKGEEIRTLKGHTNTVYCCAVFLNGTKLVSGGYDNTLKVWDLALGEEIRTLKGHTSWVSCCSVFAQDTRLVSGSRDETLKVWDLASGEEMYTIRGHGGDVNCCAVFAQGLKLISGSDDGTLKVWELPSTLLPQRALY